MNLTLPSAASNKLIRALLVVCSFANGYCQAQTFTISESPVRVTFSTNADERDDPTTIDVTIRHDTQTFRFQVLQRGKKQEALTALKMRTGWKDGFLFVRDDCIGGTAWRCNVDQVFTFIDVKDDKRLIYLGDVAVTDQCVEELRFGCSLYRGIFTDIYDTAELNNLASHAESPGPMIEMRIKGAEFVVDLDETWGRNQERYRAGEQCLKAKVEERSSACVDGITPLTAYLFNTTLAAYTKHTEQLASTRTFARSALCEKLAESECSEQLRKSALLLASVKPGARPKARGLTTINNSVNKK